MMMMRSGWMGGALLMVVAVAVPAGAGVQTQADLNRMATADYREADAAMNAQYRATMAEMRARDAEGSVPGQCGPSYRYALLAAQRAWIAWRDAECLVAGYSMRGGTAQPMVELGCKARLTEQRTAALRSLAE